MANKKTDEGLQQFRRVFKSCDDDFKRWDAKRGEAVKLKLTKGERVLFEQLIFGTKSETVTNRFSKVEVELSPEAVAVYDLIMGAERSAASVKVECRDKDYELMDIGKSIFSKNWPDAYMKLID